MTYSVENILMRNAVVPYGFNTSIGNIWMRNVVARSAITDSIENAFMRNTIVPAVSISVSTSRHNISFERYGAMPSCLINCLPV